MVKSFPFLIKIEEKGSKLDFFSVTLNCKSYNNLCSKEITGPEKLETISKKFFNLKSNKDKSTFLFAKVDIKNENANTIKNFTDLQDLNFLIKNVLKVFADLHKFESNFYLEIVGSGPEKSKLENFAKKMKVDGNITFTSHLSQIDLFRRMAESEYFIFLSNKKSERLPNVLKEAMQCGCVCISSKTKGIEELIQHGVNGFTMSDYNPDDVQKYFLLSDNEKKNIFIFN